MHFISVIIPFHKNISKLKRSIKSVNNQILPKNTLIEICIGNDSNYKDDFLLFELKSILKYQTFIFKNNFSKGAGNSRNAAINGSKGNLLAFLDADDYWESEKITKQITAIEKGYNFISTDFKYKGQNIVVKTPLKIKNYKSFFFSHSIGTSTVMLKKELVKEKRFINIKYCQDILFWSSVAKSKSFRFKSINKPLVNYSLNGRTSKSSYFERFYFYVLSCYLAKLNILEIILSLIHYSTKGLLNRFFKLIISRNLTIFKNFNL